MQNNILFAILGFVLLIGFTSLVQNYRTNEANKLIIEHYREQPVDSISFDFSYQYSNDSARSNIIRIVEKLPVDYNNDSIVNYLGKQVSENTPWKYLTAQINGKYVTYKQNMEK